MKTLIALLLLLAPLQGCAVVFVNTDFDLTVIKDNQIQFYQCVTDPLLMDRILYKSVDSKGGKITVYGVSCQSS